MLIFNAVIEENRWKIANVGVHVGELDSQQNWNGYADMVSYGCELYPQMVCIRLKYFCYICSAKDM